MKSNSKIQEKRSALKELSMQARAYRDAIIEQGGEDGTINEFILELFYPNIDRSELNTFDQWKKQGFSVKRGEKAINLWGKPRKTKQQETEDEYKFWPLVYLFDRSQVEASEIVESYNKEPV